MGLAAWDSASLYASYNLVYLARLNRWEGISLGLAVIVGTWLGVSYLTGRYSPNDGDEERGWLTVLIKTSIAVSAVIAVFIGHSWLFQVVDAETRFRGFLIPLLVGGWLLSASGNIFWSIVNRKERKWVLVGSENEREVVLRELAYNCKTSTRLRLLSKKEEWGDIEQADKDSNTGIAVGSISKRDDLPERILRLREAGRRVVSLLNWCEQELQRIPPELVHKEWLVHAEGFCLRPNSMSWRIKRLSDIVGSVMLIALTAPIAIVAGMLIWLEDRGPIFYGQTRSGLNGRHIKIWKLRSMKVNAEKDGIKWATRSDPRVTNIGSVIRAMRIDELPQLFNVINGDLSLIGPRPERPEIEEDLQVLIPNYRVRHWIRPGLSGWAQVCYPYGASIEDSRMKLSYDLYYIRNASILLDVLILLKTIRLVAHAEGASPPVRQGKGMGSF